MTCLRVQHCLCIREILSTDISDAFSHIDGGNTNRSNKLAKYFTVCSKSHLTFSSVLDIEISFLRTYPKGMEKQMCDFHCLFIFILFHNILFYFVLCVSKWTQCLIHEKQAQSLNYLPSPKLVFSNGHPPNYISWLFLQRTA